MRQTFRLALCLLATGLATASCVDKNYDLDKIDKTIAIGSEEGFALPGNNTTSQIQMADLVELEGNDFISISDEGDYYITRNVGEDEVTPATPVIPEVTMTSISDESEYDYDVAEVTLEARSNSPSYTGTGSKTAREIYHFEFNNIDQIADILNLTTVDLQTGINITLKFSEQLKKEIDNLEYISINLPDYFDLDVVSSYQGTTFDNATNTLSIVKPTYNDITMTVRLNGLRFTNGEPDPDGYSAYFTPDSCSFVGGVILDTKYTGDLSQLVDELIIKCVTSMEDTVTLTKATGFFNPEIELGEENGAFEINNLPDILDDEEAHLNLSDPELRIWINSNMDIRGIVEKLRIVSTDARGNKTYVEVETGNGQLKVDPHTGFEKDVNGNLLTSTKTMIVITDDPNKAQSTAHQGSHAYYATCKSGYKLADLFYNIPHKVAFDVNVAADPNYEGTIRLGYKDDLTKEPWYTIQPSYEFNSPLALNPGSVIVYRDSITGWHKDLEDVTLSKGSRITLTANVYNHLPMDLKMHAKALELVGEEQWKDLDESLLDITITDMEGNDVRVAAGTENTLSVTPIKIELNQKSVEAFKRIDGITYSATCLASDDPEKQGITLNERTQKLYINDIGVILRGKIIFDLND